MDPLEYDAHEARAADEWHLMQALGVGELQAVMPAIETLRREREEALQEAGRLRARVEAFERLLREQVADRRDEPADPNLPLYEARELLGLDGRTGHREVNAEVGDRG